MVFSHDEESNEIPVNVKPKNAEIQSNVGATERRWSAEPSLGGAGKTHPIQFTGYW